MTCAPLLLVAGVGCSSGGGGTQTGTGGTTTGSGGTATGSGGNTPAGSGGQGGAGATGTGGGSGGMAATDADGSGGVPAGNDGSVAETHPDVPPSGDGGAGNAWIGTWAAAPQGCGAGAGQTVRSIVHTSIGGNAARVRISNVMGGGPLHISNVHLAQRTTGSSIDPASDKALTFNGQPDVTVAARMVAFSDGVDFVVKPTSDVAISFFVVSSSGGTCQPNAFQTNYAVGGNMVSAPTLNGGGNNSYLYVLGLDVQNPAGEGAVVTLGASITTGFQAG
ncbi:MAG TPA: hypothetical protein VNO55_21710, partial [Polyangia bacterium]|nr:hypothetical protein [Polyangia bacterium]